jgi:hypothetical protein
MITRRSVLGAGLAFASMAYSAGLRAFAHTSSRNLGPQPSDVLLLDSDIELPDQLAVFLNGRHTKSTVIPLHLDAASHAGLMRVLNDNHAIIGISSGATLFCLERLAWDHGFRMTGRTQACVSAFGDKACHGDMKAFIDGARSSAAGTTSIAQTYRPSRADGLLHAWAMQKSAGVHPRQNRREGWQ